MTDVDYPATAALKAQGGFDTTIGNTLGGTSEVYHTVCGLDPAWLDELHQLLPDLPIPEARFSALALIAGNAFLIYERALDLLVELAKVDPGLQDLIAGDLQEPR